MDQLNGKLYAPVWLWVLFLLVAAIGIGLSLWLNNTLVY